MHDHARKYTAEFLASFVLVFAGTAVMTLQRFPGFGDAGGLAVAAAFGGTLGLVRYIAGPVSGGLANPAVTIPMAVSGRLHPKLLPGYLAAQVAGGIAASAVLWMFMRSLPGFDLAVHGLGGNRNPTGMAPAGLFGLEILTTGVLVFTAFRAPRGETATELGAASLAIGAWMFIAHVLTAPLGYGSLNPARSIGPAVFVRGEPLALLWVFTVGPALGGIIGWLIHEALYRAD